jgi:AcrR family transcriptional regulator
VSQASTTTIDRIRRTPLQERSTGTVQQILRAASDLLATEPLDQVTTSRVAHAAGVSVGGLYRFFPDKQSIIDAIAVKHVDDLRAVLEAQFADTTPEDGRLLLGAIVDAYVAFLDQRPDFRAIALGRHVSAGTRHQHASPEVGPAALVKRFFLDQFHLDLGDLDLKIRIASEAGERLIAYAYEQPEPERRAAVVSELKAMLGKYFFD